MAKKSNKEQREKCKILTPEFRVSYPHVFKAQGMKGAVPKFSVTGLFKKTADLTVIKRALKNAKIAKFGSDESDWPSSIESPVTDGDDSQYADRDGYKGHWAIKFSTSEDQRPGVFDEEAEPITESAKFYPGCYAHAKVFAYVWEFPANSGRYGVGFILDHVQKTKDGKPFGGKGPADFKPLDTSADENEEEEEVEDFT